MSVALSQHLAGWDSARNALGELCASHGEFEQFFSRVFDQLESLAAELVGRQKQWQSQCGETESEIRQRETRLEEDREALSAQREQLEQTAREQRKEDAAATTQNTSQWQQFLEEARQERAELHGTQEAVEAQVARLAAVAAELAEVRNVLPRDGQTGAAGDEQLKQMLEEARRQELEQQNVQQAVQAQIEKLTTMVAELADARNDSCRGGDNEPLALDQLQEVIQETRNQGEHLRGAQEAAQSQAEQLAAAVAELTAARNLLTETRNEITRREEQQETGEADAARTPISPELQEQVRQMEQQRTLLEQERMVLESELEAVRNRAAEMAELLADHKRQAAQQQTQWGNELKRMRCLLEQVSGRLAEGELPAGAAEPQAAPAAVEDADSCSAADDPVLDSVMAQFEMLQKDLARRRAANLSPAKN